MLPPEFRGCWVSWVRRYLRFHHMRHPREMGQDEINAFLTHLAVKEKLSASSQNQALGGTAVPLPHGIGW